MRARHAHTLIECMVALTLIGATLSSVALMMHATRQANRRVRDAVACELDMGRLAAQLRTDAHQARSAKIENAKEPGARRGSPDPAATADHQVSVAVLSLALPDDRTAEYTLLPQGVQRVLRRGQTVRHRETYGLPASCAGRWLLRTGSRSPVVSFVLEPAKAGSGGEAPAGVCRVDAAVHLLRSDSRTPKP